MGGMNCRSVVAIRLLGVGAAGSVVVVAVAVAGWYYAKEKRRRRQHEQQAQESPKCSSSNGSSSSSAYESQIGHTPCILLPNLSRALRCEIYAKLECANPGSTGKDRAALAIIAAAEREGRLPPPSSATTASYPTTQQRHIQRGANNNNNSIEKGLNSLKVSETSESKRNGISSNGETKTSGTKNDDNDDDSLYDLLIARAMERSATGGLIVEGTSGSTGISLATLAATRGHACLVVLPDDQAHEKTALLETLGAVAHTVSTASIASPHHYVNVAQSLCRRARDAHRIPAIFGNQFENEANWQIHYATTGPEIWRQCRPDCFVMSAGTGGTIAGVARYLKEQQQQHHQCPTTVVLADPPGSVLHAKIEHGVAFCVQQREAQLRRHRYDSIAEGIGLDRVTGNVAAGLHCIDAAVAVTDQQAVDLAHWMLRREGLLLGSSSAVNLVGACRVALQWEQQQDQQLQTTQKTRSRPKRICTVICDTGQRHLTRFWNRSFILSRGLEWPGDRLERDDHQFFSTLL